MQKTQEWAGLVRQRGFTVQVWCISWEDHDQPSKPKWSRHTCALVGSIVAVNTWKLVKNTMFQKFIDSKVKFPVCRSNGRNQNLKRLSNPNVMRPKFVLDQIGVFWCILVSGDWWPKTNLKADWTCILYWGHKTQLLHIFSNSKLARFERPKTGLKIDSFFFFLIEKPIPKWCWSGLHNPLHNLGMPHYKKKTIPPGNVRSELYSCGTIQTFTMFTLKPGICLHHWWFDNIACEGARPDTDIFWGPRGKGVNETTRNDGNFRRSYWRVAAMPGATNVLFGDVLGQKRPNGPEISRAVFINFDYQSFLFVVKNVVFSMSTESCLVTFDCEFHWDLMKMCVFVLRKLKWCIKGPSKNVYEKWGCLRFPAAAALLFRHVNLQRVFPVMSYTSVSRWM